MQPYFMPYLGYFSLVAAVDLFVLYDCVQFPRRGRVHRNQLPDARGEARWLTLPLVHCPRTTPIRSVRLRDTADVELRTQLRRFPGTAGIEHLHEDWIAHLLEPHGDLTGYLEQLLRLVSGELGLTFTAIRSSSLDIAASLAGQERILAIAAEVGASEYVNLPGGRALYSEADFVAHDLQLRFIRAYDGPRWSMLHRLLTEDRAALRAEVHRHARAQAT